VGGLRNRWGFVFFRTFLKILRVFGVSVESKEDMLFKM
jgi:hypothetical protein